VKFWHICKKIRRKVRQLILPVTRFTLYHVVHVFKEVEWPTTTLETMNPPIPNSSNNNPVPVVAAASEDEADPEVVAAPEAAAVL
jgi:hypothetical protein